MATDTLLMVGDSERDANMLYAAGIFVPDPFIFLRHKGVCHLAVSDVELRRARRQTRHCKVQSLSTILRSLKRDGLRSPTMADAAAELLRDHTIRKVNVPHNFSVGLARAIEDHGIRIKVRKNSVFPERQVKSPAEVKKISAALLMAEVGMSEAVQTLRHAKIGKGNQLYLRGIVLTVEKLRSIVDVAVLQAGGLSSRTIVASGARSCDPHGAGHGPLRAGEPIVIDVFPRSLKTGYFGDMTRTVVKGRAPDLIRRMYHTVVAAQEVAFSAVAEGISCAKIHKAVEAHFVKEGFKTRRRDGEAEGFIHGTGHGLGLEIHESPRLNGHSTDTLKLGNVITIEPGLYYPRVGGVRVEDVVLVTKSGARNLTKFEKVLEV